MNTYELMLIYNPNSGEAEVKTQFEAVKSKITDSAGKIVSEDFWGLKDLAYAMVKFTQAYYIVLVFQMDSDKLKTFSDYISRQQTHVIRGMISVVDTKVEKN